MFTAVFAAACWLSVSAETVEMSTHVSPTQVTSQQHATTTAASAGNNATRKSNTTMLFNIAGMEQANGVVLRAFYVIVGVMMIILVYFVVRIVRYVIHGLSGVYEWCHKCDGTHMIRTITEDSRTLGRGQ